MQFDRLFECEAECEAYFTVVAESEAECEPTCVSYCKILVVHLIKILDITMQ